MLATTWVDPEFTALAPMEQWTYFMLLSQPRLTLVGSLDYRPHHWAEHAAGLTRAAVEASVGLLEDALYVVVDRCTEELLIRSMTRHDGLRTGNPKLMAGLWNAWAGVASRRLREVAVVNMPPDLFGQPSTPEAAEKIRRSARTDCTIGWPIDRSNGPPSNNRRPTSDVPQSARESDRIDPDLRAQSLNVIRQMKAKAAT